MKTFYSLLAYILLVSACSSPPSANAVATAIAQTQIAIPTNTIVPSSTPTSSPELTSTPTPIPLSNIDLESILLLPGDLPVGFTGGQVDNNATGIYSVPEPDQFISQQFDQSSTSMVGIVVMLFTNEDDSMQAYKNISVKAEETIPNVGDMAGGSFSDTKIAGMEIHITSLTFIRCHSVVYIYGISESVDKKVASIYAQRLDKRLEKIICN